VYGVLWKIMHRPTDVKPVEQSVKQPAASCEQNQLNVCSYDAAGCSIAVVKPHKRLTTVEKPVGQPVVKPGTI